MSILEKELVDELMKQSTSMKIQPDAMKLIQNYLGHVLRETVTRGYSVAEDNQLGDSLITVTSADLEQVFGSVLLDL